LKYNILEYRDGNSSLGLCRLPIPYQTSSTEMALERLHQPLRMPKPGLEFAKLL
jgi:hypothetical protein